MQPPGYVYNARIETEKQPKSCIFSHSNFYKCSPHLLGLRVTQYLAHKLQAGCSIGIEARPPPATIIQVGPLQFSHGKILHSRVDCAVFPQFLQRAPKSLPAVDFSVAIQSPARNSSGADREKDEPPRAERCFALADLCHDFRGNCPCVQLFARCFRVMENHLDLFFFHRLKKNDGGSRTTRRHFWFWTCLFHYGTGPLGVSTDACSDERHH